MSQANHDEPSTHDNTTNSRGSVTNKALHSFWRHHHKISVAVLIFFIIIIGLLGFQFISSNLLSAHQSRLLQQQSTALSAINGTPSPDNIAIGQPNGPARVTVVTTEEKLANTNEAIADMRVRSHHRFLAYFDGGASATIMRKLRGDIRSIRSEHIPAMSQYHDSFSAVLQFLEYSPRVDMIDYDSDSPDTQERLERLSAGLDDITTELTGFSTPLADELLGSMASSQDTVDQLKESQDVDAFIEDFSAQQERAKQSLIDSYNEVYPAARSDITTLSRTIQQAFRQ